jgi:multiple sugar transport system permease protein
MSLVRSGTRPPRLGGSVADQSVSLASGPTALAPARPRRLAPAAWLALAVCATVMAIMAAPLVFSLLTSVETKAEAAATAHYLPHTFSLQSYLKVIGYQAGLATYVGNSTLVALMTILACIALAAPAGFGLARYSPRGKEIGFLILLTPMMIPYQILLTPLYLDFAKVGLVNSRIGLAIVHTILQLPFSVYLMRNAFEAIPREIEEAAMIDGCSPLERLTKVFLPLAVPALVTVALFAFITSWNEFLAALVFMNRESSFTMPILLVSVRTGDHGAIDWGALQAGIVFSVIPCLVVYLALQRYYISGLLSGAVKT